MVISRRAIVCTGHTAHVTNTLSAHRYNSHLASQTQ